MKVCFSLNLALASGSSFLWLGTKSVGTFLPSQNGLLGHEVTAGRKLGAAVDGTNLKEDAMKGKVVEALIQWVSISPLFIGCQMLSDCANWATLNVVTLRKAILSLIPTVILAGFMASMAGPMSGCGTLWDTLEIGATRRDGSILSRGDSGT